MILDDFWDQSFSHYFFSFLLFVLQGCSGLRDPEGVLDVFDFKNLIFHFRTTNARSKVRLTQNTLPSSMFGNMFSESPLASPKRLPQGNTCVSMAKMRILGRKSHQNDRFEPKFRHFF